MWLHNIVYYESENEAFRLITIASDYCSFFDFL